MQDSGEPGIAGVTIQLNGVDSQNNPFTLVTTTDAAGHYQFNNLLPGTYTITEIQPLNYMDGKDSLGSLGGQQTNDQFAGIALPAGGSGINYNFGEILPSTISGYVYQDTGSGYNDGIMQADELHPRRADHAHRHQRPGAVSLQPFTDSTGLYSFNGLRPGDYTVMETQPAGYIDGKDTIRRRRGRHRQRRFQQYRLGSYINDYNNNFGELKPVILVSHDPLLPPAITPEPPVFSTPPITVGITTKGQLLASTASTVETTSSGTDGALHQQRLQFGPGKKRSKPQG